MKVFDNEELQKIFEIGYSVGRQLLTDTVVNALEGLLSDFPHLDPVLKLRIENLKNTLEKVRQK